MNTTQVEQSTKVMIVEDNPVYRRAVVSGLSSRNGFECSGDVSSAEDAFRYLERSRILPDVILLDLEMPGIHGLDAIKDLKHRCPETEVIVLTQSDNEAHVLRAIRFGAAGYLLKTSTMNQICDCIRTVRSGGADLDSGIAKLALDFVRRAYDETGDEDSDALTGRELEVLQMLSEGLLKKEIADRLEITIHAVDMRMRRIYSKLRVNNVAAAIGEAFRKGVI